jgi:hypothetical protein
LPLQLFITLRQLSIQRSMAFRVHPLPHWAIVLLPLIGIIEPTVWSVISIQSSAGTPTCNPCFCTTLQQLQ